MDQRKNRTAGCCPSGNAIAGGYSLKSVTAELISAGDIKQDLVDSWANLARSAAEPNVFYEPWFLLPAIDYFQDNRDLKLFILWAGEPKKSDLVAILPIGPERQFGRWPVPHIQNWLHHNCFLGTPLVRSGFEQKFWNALFKTMDAGDWPGFLHINSLTIGGPLDRAMRDICRAQNRRCDLVHSQARAFLSSKLTSDKYYEAVVRSKKRKELRRQAKRLGELGDVSFAHFTDDCDLDQWIGEFLTLERRGWKGQNGSALDCENKTREFFHEVLNGAAKAGQLERHEIRLDGKPLAMLVNFHSASGSFSFKTAFDEDYARFSTGVLLQLQNLKILENPEIKWMDSCAAEGHPMIDSLWVDRRHIGRFSIALSGLSRRTIFSSVRLAEDIMAHIKRREIIDVMKAVK